MGASARERGPLGVAAMAAALTLALSSGFARGDDPALPLAPVAPWPAPLVGPFAPLVDRLSVGEAVAAGPYRVVPFTISGADLPPARFQPGPPAWVGLWATGAQVIDLPVPVGLSHVRVSNPLPVALEIPAGEVVRSPTGMVRVVDRFVWIPAGEGAFVPVLEGAEPLPAAPFTALPVRLSPVQLSVLASGGGLQGVVHANTMMGAVQSADPAPAYASPRYAALGGPVLVALEQIRLGSPSDPLVGLAVFDTDEGLRYATLESDPIRFAARWPALIHGIALDAAVKSASGALAAPGGPPSKWGALAAAAIRELREVPAMRPAYGAGLEARWPASGTPRWLGLVADDGGPVTASFVAHVPVPGVQPPPPPTPPPPPPPTPPPDPTPGSAELGRKDPVSPLDQRLKDRRD